MVDLADSSSLHLILVSSGELPPKALGALSKCISLSSSASELTADLYWVGVVRDVAVSRCRYRACQVSPFNTSIHIDWKDRSS